MLLVDGAGGVLLLALWLFCLVDVIVTSEHMCRNLPKLFWLLIVLVLPDVGSLLWLIAGRPRAERRATGSAYAVGFPTRGTSAVADNPDDDEAFMRQLRERAEQQRRRAREQQEQTGLAQGGDSASPEPPRPDTE